MDIVPFILWNHLVKNCQTFENLAVLPRILWYAWQAIPPSPRGHFRSTCYIELTPTDVRGDQVMGSFEISLEDYCRIKIEDFHREQLFSAERRNPEEDMKSLVNGKNTQNSGSGFWTRVGVAIDDVTPTGARLWSVGRIQKSLLQAFQSCHLFMQNEIP